VPIQLAQCGSLGWPFPMYKYKYIFQIRKIYGSYFMKQHSETVTVEITKTLIAVSE